jgi:transcriptional regulator with XRE-family HTH domain
MEDTQTLGDLIRESRLARGFSLGQLATKLGQTAAAVRSWERSAALPGSDMLEALAEALSLDRSDLSGLAALEAAALEDAPSEDAPSEDAPSEDAPLEPAALGPVEAEPPAAPDAAAEADAGAAEVEAEVEVEAEAGQAGEPEPDTQADSEVDVEADADAESTVEAEVEAQVDTESAIEADDAGEAGPEADDIEYLHDGLDLIELAEIQAYAGHAEAEGAEADEDAAEPASVPDDAAEARVDEEDVAPPVEAAVDTVPPYPGADEIVVHSASAAPADTPLADLPTETIGPPIAAAHPGSAVAAASGSPSTAVAVEETPDTDPNFRLTNPFHLLFDPTKNWLYWIRAALTVVILLVLLRVLFWAVVELWEAITDVLGSFRSTDEVDQLINT